VLRRSFQQGAVILWSIWPCRNDYICNNAFISSPMQVLFRSTFWFRFWSNLLGKGEQKRIKDLCLKLETFLIDIYTRNGWKFVNTMEP
jgi:hypothetical protein